MLGFFYNLLVAFKDMKIKYLYQLVFLICLYGCSDNLSERGLIIICSPRQGFQYYDPPRAEYNYRYNTISITNDTTVAIQVDVVFSETEMSLKDDSIRFKVFLLPRHLTPNEQHYDQQMSKELKRFLDFEINTSEHLSTVINPSENCVFTFGVLTNARYPDPTTPYQTKLLTSCENSSVNSLKLKINDSLIIPCGTFSYLKK